jgi:MFS family permease
LQDQLINNYSRRKEILVALLTAVVAFAAYTAIFCFRKAFNVAGYTGHRVMGLNFKILLVVTQVAGYMLSKFYGIKFIAELKRVGRGRLIVLLVLLSWIAWLLFAIIPPPYNFWCLALNGFPLGMLWGIVFSYIEGRRATDFISAALAVSFIFGSGVAKSVALFVMNKWNINEYWMPFAVGLIFMIPLLVMVYALEKIPPPTVVDEQERMKRQPMTGAERMLLLKKFGVGIALLVLIYSMVTILREVRDSFMADMWRESGEQFNSSVFARTETIVSLSILLMIGIMVLVRNNFSAFLAALLIMLAGFLIAGMVTVLHNSHTISFFYWITFTGLGLYMVYIPFNSILFERFIAAYRFTGNVGFLIYIADSVGYLGSVGVLLSKSVFSVKLSWLSFYSGLVTVMAIGGVLCTVMAMIYFVKRKANRASLPG